MNEPERLHLLNVLRAVTVRLGADLCPADAPPVRKGIEGLAYAVARIVKSPGNVQALAYKAGEYLAGCCMVTDAPKKTKGAK
jgi:hypothetical protein